MKCKHKHKHKWKRKPNVNVNEHLLRTLFSTSLAQKHDYSRSLIFHTEVQKHRQLLWHCGTFFILLVGVMYMAYSSLMYSLLMSCLNVCGHMRSPYVYRLCLARRVSFSTWAQSLITANQQRIVPYFKSQLCVEDPGHRKPVLIFSNGLSKPRERVHDRNKFLPQVRFEPTIAWLPGQHLTAELSLLILSLIDTKLYDYVGVNIQIKMPTFLHILATVKLKYLSSCWQLSIDKKIEPIFRQICNNFAYSYGLICFCVHVCLCVCYFLEYRSYLSENETCRNWDL